MEIEQLKSSSATEDEMEMMMMMDKLPEFLGAYNDLGPSTEFPGGASSCTNNKHFMNSPHIPSFMSLPSNTPFTNNNINTQIQDESTPPPFLSNTERWREFPGANGYSNSTVKMASQKKNSMGAMREMIFRIASMQPIHIDPESVKPPKRRNVKISKDPQSVAARHRRERISERIRILQRLVPGGTKMDTASMLDEAIHYVKFLKTQVQSLERAQANRPSTSSSPGIGFPVAMSSGTYFPMGKPYHHHHHQNIQHYRDA